MANHNFRTLLPFAAIDVLSELLLSEYTRRYRILLHGVPGIGKTEIIEAVAERMRRRYKEVVVHAIHLLTLDLGALRGLERIEGEGHNAITIPARPYFLPPYTPDDQITDETPRYILFLDEIMAADDAIRKCAFELLTSHRVGPHLLGKNVFVVGAGNSAEDGTIVHEMDRATRDRFLHILIDTSAEAVVKYGQDHGWHPRHISFIHNNKGLILPSDDDFTNDNLATPSPRSHGEASKAHFALDAGQISRETFEVAIVGWLGTAAAEILFQNMDDEESRFDLEQLFKAAPHERVYPASIFGAFTLASALAYHAKQGPEQLDQALDVMLAMPANISSCVEEAKNSFFFQVEDKFHEYKLFGKYAHDPRVRGFLKESHDVTALADQAHADQQADDDRQAA